MDKQIIDAMNNALTKAGEELDKARYLEESGSNAGLRKINATKAEWLSWVIYLANYGFKQMGYDEEPAEIIKSVEPSTDFQRAIKYFKNVKNNF